MFIHNYNKLIQFLVFIAWYYDTGLFRLNVERLIQIVYHAKTWYAPTMLYFFKKKNMFDYFIMLIAKGTCSLFQKVDGDRRLNFPNKSLF